MAWAGHTDGMDGWPGWALPKAWQKSLKELKTLSKCASHLSAVKKPAEKNPSALFTSTVAAPLWAALLQRWKAMVSPEPSQPVLVPVSKQGYRRGPGSRAKGEETTGATAWLRWWQGAS